MCVKRDDRAPVIPAQAESSSTAIQNPGFRLALCASGMTVSFSLN
jgi:hypothetical protein